MRYVSSKEMRRVDNIAVKYGISIPEMMEMAGKNLADFVLRYKPKKVCILYGKGNNGGGGLVCARYLLIKNVKIEIIRASKDVNSHVKNQLKILKKSGISPKGNIGDCDLIVDALLGYNQKGNPRGKYADLINEANSKKVRIISWDIPTGMNPDTGEKNTPCINYDSILTVALPKTGLKKVKNLYLTNIGITKEVYDKAGIKINNYFTKENIIKISR